MLVGYLNQSNWPENGDLAAKWRIRRENGGLGVLPLMREFFCSLNHSNRPENGDLAGCFVSSLKILNMEEVMEKSHSKRCGLRRASKNLV